MSDAITRILCRLLWLANSDPPCIHRQRFYAMKYVMLRRWATPAGYDVQHIRKECYGCDGTGVYRDSGRDCRRCWGSGAYSDKWYRLDRWEWHGRIFHTPAWEITRRDANPVATIEGHVQHTRGLGRKPDEAALWLALLFDRGLFWKLLTGGSPCGWTGLPLCTLNQAVFGVAMHWQRSMRRFRSRRHRMPELRSWDWTDDVPF